MCRRLPAALLLAPAGSRCANLKPRHCSSLQLPSRRWVGPRRHRPTASSLGHPPWLRWWQPAYRSARWGPRRRRRSPPRALRWMAAAVRRAGWRQRLAWIAWQRSCGPWACRTPPRPSRRRRACRCCSSVRRGPSRSPPTRSGSRCRNGRGRRRCPSPLRTPCRCAAGWGSRVGVGWSGWRCAGVGTQQVCQWACQADCTVPSPPPPRL